MRHFRETLWFKKGLLEGDQALEAELTPLEDRYAEDGSVSPADSAALSLGGDPRKAIAAVSLGEGPSVAVLARDMQRGRHKVIAMLGASVAALGLMVTLYVT